MLKNIILSGVGGQGILSIATVIAEAATKAGLYLKQAEVHGMSQRGGDVQSHLRLSTDVLYSDLIREGAADIIISMEPMEALRYVSFLAPQAWIVSSSEPFVNIPNYPDKELIERDLANVSQLLRAPIEAIAKENFIPKSSNMILLGMAANVIEILTADQLREAIAEVFARKGEKIVNDNIKAFELGLSINK